VQVEELADLASKGECVASDELINVIGDKAKFNVTTGRNGTLLAVDPPEVCHKRI
jgi:hypothetical protein